MVLQWADQGRAGFRRDLSPLLWLQQCHPAACAFLREALLSIQLRSQPTSPAPAPSLALGYRCHQHCFQLPAPSLSSECILGVLTWWLPAGTGDQLSSGRLVGFSVFWPAFTAVSDKLKSRGTESLQQIFAFLSTAVASGRLVVRYVVLKPCSYVWLLDTNPSQEHPAQVDKAVAERWMYYDKVKRAFVAEIGIEILTSSLPLQSISEAGCLLMWLWWEGDILLCICHHSLTWRKVGECFWYFVSLHCISMWAVWIIRTSFSPCFKANLLFWHLQSGSLLVFWWWLCWNKQPAFSHSVYVTWNEIFGHLLDSL